MNNIILLGFVSLINDISSKIILPVLPLYITQLGGTGLVVGLVSGLGDSVASFLKVLSGYWSDNSGKRKPFVFSGYALSAVSKLLFAFANSWPIVLVLKVFERTGKGLRSASRDAMIAATAKEGQKGKAFGVHRAFDSGGAVVGSLLALVFVVLFSFTLEKIFLIAGIISMFSLIPLLFSKETGKQKRSSKAKLLISFKNLPKRLKLFIIGSAVFAMGNFSYMFFVLKAQQNFGNMGGSELVVPVSLYILYYFIYTLAAIPSGMMADRFGKINIIIAGYSLFILVTGGFIFFQSLAAYIVLFVIYGLMFALIESNERALVTDLAPKDVKGTALGTYYSLTSIAALPAGLITGFLFDINTRYAFIYGMAAAIISIVILVVIRGRLAEKKP